MEEEDHTVQGSEEPNRELSPGVWPARFRFGLWSLFIATMVTPDYRPRWDDTVHLSSLTAHTAQWAHLKYVRPIEQRVRKDENDRSRGVDLGEQTCTRCRDR